MGAAQAFVKNKLRCRPGSRDYFDASIISRVFVSTCVATSSKAAPFAQPANDEFARIRRTFQRRHALGSMRFQDAVEVQLSRHSKTGVSGQFLRIALMPMWIEKER